TTTTNETRPGSWRHYGVGIDVHSKFAAVSVLIPLYGTQEEKRFKKHFSTATPDLAKGQEWVFSLLTLWGVKYTPEHFHYTIESTSCYHYPLLRQWKGQPAVVNPNLIRQGSRKTDDIDSLALAEMDLAGRWATSYVHTDDQQA